MLCYSALFVCSVSLLYMLLCQYQCKRLTGKTRLQNDMMGMLNPIHSFTHSLGFLFLTSLFFWKSLVMPGPRRSAKETPLGIALYRPDALPVTEPTVSKHWNRLHIITITMKTSHNVRNSTQTIGKAIGRAHTSIGRAIPIRKMSVGQGKRGRKGREWVDKGVTEKLQMKLSS